MLSVKITRRRLAVAAFAPAAVALTQASAQAQAPPASGEDLNALAQSLMRANSGILTKAAIPIEAEPAFQFKA